jgi:hypothetical protein
MADNIENTKKTKNSKTIIVIAVVVMLIIGYFCCGGSTLFERSPISGEYKVLVDRVPMFEIPNHRAEGRIIKHLREGDYLNIPDSESSLKCEEYSEYERSFFKICRVEEAKTGKVGWVLQFWKQYDQDGNHISTKLYFR